MDLAHGVGGGADLPIPASYAVFGGTAALTLSFAVLVLAWRAPRYQPRHRDGQPVPPALAAVVDSRGFRVALRGLGLALLAFAVWCGLAGEDDPATNPLFGMVYVLLWVGLVPASLLFGPVVRALSPARTIHAALTTWAPTRRQDGFATLPPWVGYWPAAAGLLAFTWLELVSTTGTSLSTVGAWFVGYVVLVVGGAVLFGERWFGAADPFEVYSTLTAHLSVWARRDDGTLVVLSPLRNLARVPVQPGLVAVVGVLLGSTAFDSYRDSASWVRFRQSTELDVTALETVLLVAAAAVVTLAFVAATRAPNRLAHSVVPIVVGYMTAHYLTLFVETGQLTMILASDPLNNGSDLFGIAERRVDVWLSLHPSLLATLKVLAIVLGHVVGVIAAHDRSIAELPRDRQVSGQLPLLAVMVAYTFGGLYLLFGL